MKILIICFGLMGITLTIWSEQVLSDNDGNTHDMCLDKAVYFDSSCTELVSIPEAELEYKFFVAGHTYGKPGVSNIGFHPPFKRELPNIKGEKEIEFGILTGDINYTASKNAWDAIDRDIESLGIPVYIAVGNHDVGYASQRKLYESRYGNTYYSFVRGEDLFIVLDPNIDHWSISGDQLDFLKRTLKDASQSRNIFVFFHQVLWWGADSEFARVKINSKAGRAPEVNFWTTILPLFSNLTANIYMFAGDVGAFPTGHEFHYYRDGNVHLVASGMGGGERDAYLVVSVGKESTTVSMKELKE